MTRSRALIASFAMALAAIAGVFALTSTVSLGSKAHATSDRQVAARTAQLDRYEASLRKALSQKPPKLPPVPASTASLPASTLAAAPVRVIYHRPPPIVVHKSTGSDHEDAYEDGHGDEPEGAELDD
jgi:hypothetical protein